MQVGLGIDDLPDIYRAEYLYAVELAKEQHDPCTKWDDFVEALWTALVPALGLDVTSVEPDAPRGW